MIGKNRGTVSTALPLGYELYQYRTDEKGLTELGPSRRCVVDIDAKPVPTEQLCQFAECFRQISFNDKTLMPYYKLVENALAVSFSNGICGVVVSEMDRDILECQGKTAAPGTGTYTMSTFVNCDKALLEHGVEIRNRAGMPIAERVVGCICIFDPSLMSGYFGNQVPQDKTATTGWLDTEDFGYLPGGYPYVTECIRNLIIIRGRSIRSQNIEYIAEQEPEIHFGDAIVFVTAQEKVILRIQYRVSDEEHHGQFIHTLATRIQSGFGATAGISLLPSHGISQTSSGKPVRAGTRKHYRKAYTASLYAQESLT